MRGTQAKKIRKELAKLRRHFELQERHKVADGFRKFVNNLSWWSRLKLCKEIMRRKF